MRPSFLLCAAVVASLIAPATASARTIDFPDLRKIVSLSQPQLSPNGKSLIYLRATPDYVKDRMHSDLMLMDVRSRRTRHLTWDRRGLGEPRWSPQGDRIAFLALAPSEKGDDEQDQIFVMPMDGGDAHQVTAVRSGVDDFAWSPDGSRFAFVTQNENPNKKKIDAHDDAFEVGDNDYLHTASAMPSHLWIVSADGGEAHRLTDGSWSLGTVDPDGGAMPAWSPDGKEIAVVRFPTPLVGDSLGTRVELVNSSTGSLQALTGNPGLENDPLFAPKGDLIAYDRNTNGDAANGNAVYVTRVSGGAGSDIHRDFDRNVNGKVWNADGTALFVATDEGTQSVLWYRPVNGRALSVAVGPLAVQALGNVAKTGALVFTATRPNHPSEIYLLSSPHAKPVALTEENAFVSRLQLGRVTGVTWKNDGFTEDGVLTYPAQYVAGKRYPLVLFIHGGPQGASIEGWSAQRQLFAAHGYLVFEPNYRGSTNLGDRYEHAIQRDAGDGPGRDAMAGVAAVERLGIVDTSRIAVSGWSYGGYMTSWLIGHYHVWKAAVSGAALNDWFDDYNVAFYVHTDVPFFGGSPWDPKFTAMWRAQSPIAYVRQIQTPTLIMGDIGDNNVTITNSFKMYHALKDNNVPVQFAAYPVHGHFPSDPVRSEDVVRHWVGWLDRYLK
ncbi:MAG: S9 family peptidase [Vulcanimicrobiaceae bacterium]